MSSQSADFMPAETNPIPFTGLSLDELDPARFTVAGLSKFEQTELIGLMVSVNEIFSGLNRAYDFLPPDISIAKMRDSLLIIYNRMQRIIVCSDPVGYMLCDIENSLDRTRCGLLDVVVELRAKGIDNPSIEEAFTQIDHGLIHAADHLNNLIEVMN